MSLATGKQLHAFVQTEISINDQVVYRVNNLATNENQPEITKEYPIFEWSPVIPIKDKDRKTQNKDDEIASTHEDEDDDDITENGEDSKASKKRHMNMSTHQTFKTT